jgi:TonB family protein
VAPSRLVSVDLSRQNLLAAQIAIGRAVGFTNVSARISATPPSIQITGRRDREPEAPPSGGDAGRVYEMDDPGVQSPKALSAPLPHPAYTAEAMRARIQGIVKLSCVVLPDGSVSDVEVTAGLDPGLDEQAVKAVRMWRFTPGTKDGKPVPVRMHIETQFTLR